MSGSSALRVSSLDLNISEEQSYVWEMEKTEKRRKRKKYKMQAAIWLHAKYPLEVILKMISKKEFVSHCKENLEYDFLNFSPHNNNSSSNNNNNKVKSRH